MANDPRVLPGMGLQAFADRGASEWDLWMNVNVLLLSVISQLTVDDIGTLPAVPTDGMIYIVSGGANDNNIAVRDNGAWYIITPKVGWKAKIKSQQYREMMFDGARWTIPNGDYTESFVDHGTIVTGTVTLDRARGSTKRLQVGGALTVAFSNWPSAGVVGDMFLELVNGGTGTINWPAVQWVRADGGFQSTPVRSPRVNGTDFMLFWTRDGGATVYGKFT